jgi:succinoglycan biosynthesis transport protein ExoP
MVVVTAIGLSFVPNHYKSEATILVTEQQISQRLVNPLSDDTVGQRLQTMGHEILSRGRLLEIIQEFGLFSKQAGSHEDALLEQDALVELMRKSIDIEPIDAGRDGSFTAFKVSFTSGTPEIAHAVTQKISSLFIERNSAKQVQRANATANFLKEPLEEKRKRAADLAGRIEAFKMQHARELSEGRTSSDMQLSEARMQLQNTTTNIDRAKQQEMVWESMLNGSLARLKSERAALLVRFMPKHPEVVKKDEEIAQMEAFLNNARSGSGGADAGRILSGDPAVAQLAGQIRASKLEIERLTKDEKRLEADIASFQSHLNMAPVWDQQLASMIRDSNTLNDEIGNLEKLQQQSGLSADMERNQQGQQFRQLDAASFPTKPSSPARSKITLGALGAGLVLGYLIAFLLDMRSPTFHEEREVRQRFAPPLVISVPALPTLLEKRSRRWHVSLEWIAGTMVAAAMVAVEFYVYKQR